MSKPYRVISLLKNRLYPTFQLHAFMANEKTDLHDGLRLGALTAMHWLRMRLGENAPPEWEALPSPEAYLQATDADLPPLYLNQGHVVNVVSLPDRGIWSLQITEPDLGSDPGSPNQDRLPVPGRIIETNVVFQIVGKRLECGFQTVISDPLGTNEAEVYRLAVVGQLMKNPAFGLKQAGEIIRGVTRLSNASQINTMLWNVQHADNQLPAVIFTQILEDTPEKPSLALPVERNVQEKPVFIERPDYKEKLGLSGKAVPMVKPRPVKGAGSKPAISRDLPVLSPDSFPLPGLAESVHAGRTSAPQAQAKDPLYDLDQFVRYTFAECHCYLLEHRACELFFARTGIRPEPGDTVILYPTSLGGGSRIVKYRKNKERREEAFDALTEDVRSYMKNSAIDFGRIVFLSDAREQLFRHTDELLQNARAADDRYQVEIARLKAQYDAEAEKERQKLIELDGRLQRQKEFSSRLESEKADQRIQFQEESERLKAVIREKDEIINWLTSRESRPKTYLEIEDWVKEQFSGRLILHKKAVERLTSCTSRCASTELICDALSYLASEYWEQRYLQISTEEANDRCSKKYGRPFEVTPSGTTSVQYAPRDYRIKYSRNAEGKLRESALDWHLKVGNDSENLLRIYFLHDDVKRLIVVGSLPEHLSTITFG